MKTITEEKANTGRTLLTPAALTRKFADYISEKSHKVLIAEGEKFGPELVDIIQANPQIEFTVTCSKEREKALAKKLQGTAENTKLITADIYSKGFTEEKYDLIISIPDFGARNLINSHDFISRDTDLVALQNLLYHITDAGKLLIVLPIKITLGGEATLFLQNYIENNYKIEEIDVLPSTLFYPYSSVRTYFFVFSGGKTEQISIKKLEFDQQDKKQWPGKILLTKEEISLSSAEFSALGWNIDIAFLRDDDDIKNFQKSAVNKVLLKEVATVFRGKAVLHKEESGNIAVINISNFTTGGLDYENLDHIEADERKISPYILHTGDVLVTARGTTIKIGVFTEQPFICIASANINVIRPKEELFSGYLQLFLESPLGLKILKSLERGSVVININCKDIMELKIPLPPLQEQKALSNEYQSGLKLYLEATAAAEKSWREKREAIKARLYQKIMGA